MRLTWAITLLFLAAAPLPAANPPSFLILYTDDQRWDALGCMGHPLLKTPSIDGLAASGVLFENSFVTTSICCVSRATLMTGKLCRNHQIGDFSTPLSPAVQAASLPALLKKAGYRTGCLGKWGIGGKPPEGLFDFWDAWGGQGNYFHDVNGQQVHNSTYLAMKGEEFLKGCRADQPFCLFVLYKSPHEPFLPDPQDAKLFENDTVPMPRTHTPDHFTRLPEFLQKSEGRTRMVKWGAQADYQSFVKQYLRCLAGVDRSVGRLLQALDDLKRRDDTMVVYTADNGYFLGEHGLIEKWLMHEESLRVPLLIRYPRLPLQGKRLSPMVLSIDVAPTLLDFAGVTIPAEIDGRSLRPLLEGKDVAWRDSFFYEHHFHAGGRIPRTEGVRTTDWKYITYFDVGMPYTELYDLKRDPREEKNLAADPRFKDKLTELAKLHRDYAAKLPPPVLPRPKK
jgi:arylsulfatase A-like enzyme